MNQDTDQLSEKSNECGNYFSSGHGDEMDQFLDQVKIEFENESDNFGNFISLHDENKEFKVDCSGENMGCGKTLTHDDVGNNDGKMIGQVKIKVEDEMDYFDAPSSNHNHITAFIDKPHPSEQTITNDGNSLQEIIDQVEIKLEEKLILVTPAYKISKEYLKYLRNNLNVNFVAEDFLPRVH